MTDEGIERSEMAPWNSAHFRYIRRSYTAPHVFAAYLRSEPSRSARSLHPALRALPPRGRKGLPSPFAPFSTTTRLTPPLRRLPTAGNPLLPVRHALAWSTESPVRASTPRRCSVGSARACLPARDPSVRS